MNGGQFMRRTSDNAFLGLLGKLARVPKREIDEQERKEQEQQPERAKPGAIVPKAS